MAPRRWAREAGAPGRASWRRRPSVGTCILQELVEYYQCHSLKESFKQLDTTLKYPYKSRERTASKASSRSPGNASARLAHRTPRKVCAPSCFPPPGPHCPPAPGEGFLWAALTGAGSLFRVLVPLPRGQCGERTGQVLLVLRLLPVPQPPRGSHSESQPRPTQGHVESGAGWAHRLGIQPSTLSPEAPCVL